MGYLKTYQSEHSIALGLIQLDFKRIIKIMYQKWKCQNRAEAEARIVFLYVSGQIPVSVRETRYGAHPGLLEAQWESRIGQILGCEPDSGCPEWAR